VAHDAEWSVTDLACAGVIRGPEEIEESLSDFIVGSSGAARGGYGLGAMVIDNLIDSLPDFRESVVPRNPLPFVFNRELRPASEGSSDVRVIEILHRISSARAAFGNRVG